jgi:MerR family Zn(II)-responsive transcriptional regulator of zntA
MEVKRKKNGYRYYDEKDYLKLQYLVVMKYAKFSLSEIKNILSLDIDTFDACNTFSNSMIERRILEMETIIKNYTTIVTIIKQIQPLFENAKKYEQYHHVLDTHIQSIFNEIQKDTMNLHTFKLQVKEKKELFLLERDTNEKI